VSRGNREGDNAFLLDESELYEGFENVLKRDVSFEFVQKLMKIQEIVSLNLNHDHTLFLR